MAQAKLYGQALVSAFNKEIDLSGDSFNILLLDNTYTPNQDTHRYKSDLSGEVTGTGYTAGGKVLSNVAATYDGASNTFKFDADDVSWNPSTITARYAVVYDNSPATDAVRPLIAFIDFETDQTSSGDQFTVSFNASGIVTITVS
jgi:hypothetical protein